MHSTAVAPKKEKDNDHNNSPETGIIVTHSPTKKFSKNNSSNMFIQYTYNSTLLTICIVSLYFLQQCLGTEAIATYHMDDFIPSTPPSAPYECGTLDLRQNCNDFFKLYNCTVITGYLSIVRLPRNDPNCKFKEYQFKNLREITDFLMISEVRNLSSIKNMFPNLAVIRGQKLFLNYALVVTSVHDLEKIEFKSLIAIQRGHVLVDDNAKLCYTEKVNWNRLTLRPGNNTVILEEKAECPLEVKCSGCKRDSCWSNDVCQKIENDSVISPMQDTSKCHAQCLGGCYNRTAQGCVVCKGYTDRGNCVKECPSNKYVSSNFLRCYTREECVNDKKLFILQKSCVESCPGGYKLNNDTSECDLCSDTTNCSKVCTANPLDSIFYISRLMHADNLRGCEILDGIVVINMNEFFNQQDLLENFKDVREITGHFKIYSSPYLTSLNFFQNLEKIHGAVLEHKQYALVIYNNKNLSELWQVKPGFEILNGGMYIQANDKLCHHRIRQFRENVIHDNSLDLYQSTDLNVLCSPAKLNLYLEILNHHSLKLFWSRNQTLSKVEIMYKPLGDKELVLEKSELDTDVCDRINWRKELKSQDELEKNSTHFMYIVKNVEPRTRYACLVKTFNVDNDMLEIRSEIRYGTTLFDIPIAPNISLKSKTYDTLQIEFRPSSAKSQGSQVVDYYLLEIHDIPDDRNILDTRDYCEEPVLNYKDNAHEDYDDCCSRRQLERKDQMFLSYLRKEFGCSLDNPAFCTQNTKEFNDSKERKPILKKRFEAWETNYTIRSLERFRLYVLQLQACNHAGCSTSSLISTRTNYSIAADTIYDFSACKENQTNEYKVNFSEPQLPNGYITSYALHLRYQNLSSSNNENRIVDHNYLVCITRLEHQRSNYFYIANSNYTFNEAAVRVNSLGHNSFNGWYNISICSSTKLGGSNNRGWKLFSAFFIIGITGIVVGICFKRRCFHEIPQFRRHLALYLGWRFLRPDFNATEDHQILVEGFEAVRFHNSPDEDNVVLVPQGEGVRQ